MLQWIVDAESIEPARTASRELLKPNRRENLDFVFILFSFQDKEVVSWLVPEAEEPRKY
jgi:hypothetical protein